MQEANRWHFNFLQKNGKPSDDGLTKRFFVASRKLRQGCKGRVWKIKKMDEKIYVECSFPLDSQGYKCVRVTVFPEALTTLPLPSPPESMFIWPKWPGASFSDKTARSLFHPTQEEIHAGID